MAVASDRPGLGHARRRAVDTGLGHPPAAPGQRRAVAAGLPAAPPAPAAGAGPGAEHPRPGLGRERPPNAQRRLQRLREAGFRLCLQDVGLGYPGVLELPAWPVDEWLLAPSLLNTDQARGVAQPLLQAILAAARRHAMPLVFEGQAPASLLDAAPHLIRQAPLGQPAPPT